MTNQKPLLVNFRNIAPTYRRDQKWTLEWLATAHAEAESRLQPHLTEPEREKLKHRIKKLVVRLGSANDRVQFRNSFLDDFNHTDWDKMRIFNLNRFPAGAGCTERSLLYSEIVQEMFRRFYSEELNPPSTLIHTSCTGYVAPSGAQLLVGEKNWGQSTEVLHSYHMGCYASLPSIRMAMGAVARRQGRADVVHTEICTLHLNPAEHTLEQLVVQTLFSDGIIRYSLTEDHSLATGNALEVVALREEIVSDSEKDMTWMIANGGMKMTLSREVPDRIAKALPSFLERLAASERMSLSDLQKKAMFAIHPGGPQIIDQIQDLLKLEPSQVAASNHILSQCGNMSSATLPHIWKTLLEDPTVKSGTLIVALAFGPGLTISGGLFRKLGST